MDLARIASKFLEIPILEAGARHSKSDTALLQTIHDHALSLGASCASDHTESAATVASEVRLVESSVCDVLKFRESAGQNPLVKIISPGRGSSGYYSKELLERDGPKIFKKGTLMFANHATEAEEAARPEGDWEKLVAVTSGNAYWDENGKDGPALYAPVLPMASRAKELAEKAPYTGVSIRAGGKRDDKAIAPDGKRGVITALTSAESVDVVTRAGRDGKLLLESATAEARPAQAEIPLQEAAMDAAEFKELQESNAAQALQIRKLTERLSVGEAGGVIAQHFTTLTVGEAVKKRVTGRILAASVPLTEAGELDKVKLIALVEAETKDECAYLSEVAGRQIVTGMGSGATPPTAAEIAATEAEVKAEMDANSDNYGVSTKEGKNILTMGRSAFRPDYNSRLKETA